MKILSIKKQEVYIIETDEEETPIYLRWSENSYDNLIGESWESAYYIEDKLEPLFQEFIKNKDNA